MKYETTTGKGYFTDSNGKVMSRVNVPPGEHTGPDGANFNELAKSDPFPDIDPEYMPNESKGFDSKVEDVLRKHDLI